MNYLMTLPEEILSIGAIALMLVAAWGGTASTRAVCWAAVAVLVGACIALLGPATGGGEAFGGLYRADAFAGFSKLLIFGATAIAIIMAPGFFQHTAGDDLKPEYPVLLLLAAAGMGMMVSAGDLMTLYVGLELQSLASYVLASFMRRDRRSAEAGLKYFVLGALASGILLYGVSLVYGFAGTTAFGGIADAYAAIVPGTHNFGLMFGLVFVFAGIAFKMAVVPFHMWTPDVYEGAPTPVTAFFASASKVSAVALAVRVAIEAMGPALGEWRQIVVFASLASIILGAVAAVGQSNIKRLLAYSSINNVGFILVGLAAGTADSFGEEVEQRADADQHARNVSARENGHHFFLARIAHRAQEDVGVAVRDRARESRQFGRVEIAVMRANHRVMWKISRDGVGGACKHVRPRTEEV